MRTVTTNKTGRSRRLLTPLLAIAAPILLVGAVLWPVASAMASHVSATKTFYLRNSGPTAFNLTLSETAGTATTESTPRASRP